MNSVTIKVAEQIAEIAPKVEDKVVDVIVTRELSKRADGLVKALDVLSQLEKDVKKIGPDQKSFDETGKEISQTFSKGRLDERNKLQKRIDKTTGAINKALEKGEFGDVYNLGKPEPVNDKPVDEDRDAA